MNETTNPYAIAKYVPLEARMVAAGMTYIPALHTRNCARTEGNCCPLGVVLQAMYGPKASKTPSPHGFAMGLAHPSVPPVEVERAASRFMNDWDGGRITDLAGALDVQL